MSLLADLLSKIKQPQSKREVPPNLVNIVQGSRKSSNRRRVILLSVMTAVSVTAGLSLVYFTKTLPEKSVSDISITNQERPAMPAGQIEAGTNLPRADNSSPDTPLTPLDRGELSPPLKKGVAEGFSDEKEKSAKLNLPQEDKENKDTYAPEKILDEKKEPAWSLRVSPAKHIAPDVDSFLYSAREFEMKKNYPKALENYKRALEMDRDNFVVMNSIAYILLEMNLTDESVRYSRMAIDNNKDYVPALINLGIAHAKSGNTALAEDYLDRASRLEPDNKGIIINLAILYERQKDYDRKRYRGWAPLPKMRSRQLCLSLVYWKKACRSCYEQKNRQNFSPKRTTRWSLRSRPIHHCLPDWHLYYHHQLDTPRRLNRHLPVG